jgi:hypothetical protein
MTEGPAGTLTGTPAQRLLQVRTIYAEPDARESPRGRQVLERFPGAEIIEVPSHWQIPELHGNAGNVDPWVRVKTETLVLGVKKSLSARPNWRSSDFIAPATANGCGMACAYCYVPRRKGYANPITVFTTIERITKYLRGHVARQGPKPEPNQVDPHVWVYDIGESSDVSVDALVSDTWPTWSAPSASCRPPRRASPPSSSTASCSTWTRGAAPEGRGRALAAGAAAGQAQREWHVERPVPQRAQAPWLRVRYAF